MSKRIAVIVIVLFALVAASALIPGATLAGNAPAAQAALPVEVLNAQAALAVDCGSTNEILNPAPLVWTHVADLNDPHYVAELEYGEATFDINGETLTTRAYRDANGGAYTIPGPTMNMVPGNKYVLRFRNTLPYEAPSPTHNEFKDPNVTNVHTHGLHISGETPSDDVTRLFEGGYGGDYVYDIPDIPDKHMGGTFWYHAHHHGSTFLQVSTGGFGFIMIDDSADGIPANVAAMEERHILIGYLDPGAAGTGGDTLVSGTLPAGWTVNGKVNGDLCIPKDTWQHWRVLLADRDAKTKDVTVGPNCEVKLLARDGVWRTSAPKDLPTRTVNLTGASRADLAVRCSANSDIKVANATVANVLVDGSVSDSAPHPFAADGVSQWSADRPSYLRDLRGETVGNTETIRMGARTVNGSKFDRDNPTITTTADAVQEWSIRGAANHPFHLHVYHMQAQAGCGGDFEEGEYYDTLAASCSVRFDLSPATSYEGRTIMHCHILEHEDQGAMGWMNVVGGTPKPTFPSGLGYDVKYALSGEPAMPPAAPTDLSASSLSSSTIDLSWTDNAVDKDGFTIQRSNDGTNFSDINDVAADSSSYTDFDLSANTPYWYRVFAYNAAGPSDYSNVASATTLPAGEATALDLGSVSVTTANKSQGNKAGQATVIVIDDLGSPVAGASVSGDFSGTFNEPGVSGPLTDASGSTVLETTGAQKGNVSVTFCVTGISHATLTDWSGNVCASN